MSDNDKNISYYLGANTPNGFVSLFSELYNPYEDWKVYILKGGPGTGKSGLMKKVAKFMDEKKEVVERIYCSSDPSSLDAIRLPNLKVCIVDGTAPHVVEPKFPGIVEEIVNLGDFWDADKLRENAENIRAISLKNSSFHRKSAKFLKAAYVFRLDTENIISKHVNEEKIKNFITRLSSRTIPAIYGKVGIERKMFISAITPEGLVGRYESISTLCDTVIEIEDDYGVVSDALLRELRNITLSRGHDVITCLCPMSKEEKIEHLIVPDIGFAVCTSNGYHSLPFKATQRIRSNRFVDESEIRKIKNRLKFNEKGCKELVDEAIYLLKCAKDTHDKLESYYVEAMDFDGVDKIIQKIIAQIS